MYTFIKPLKSKVYSTIIITAAVLLFWNNVFAERPAGGWLPFSPAPVSEWGGVVCTEYDQCTIGADEIAVRRILLRMGWSPSSFAAFWIEGGLASLHLESENISMQGDFGTAAGVGMTLSAAGFDIFGLSSFISGHGTMFISRLGYDKLSASGLVRSRRSRYEWWEGYGLAGLSWHVSKGIFFLGPSVRALSQEEDRHTHTNTSQYKETNTYQSALQPGITVGYFVPLKLHFNIWIAVEAYNIKIDESRIEGARVTVSVGQWGSP